MTQINYFILQWNINGLKRHLDDLKYLVRLNKFDILALQETHTSPDKDTSLLGYSSHRYDYTLGGKASGGVAIFVKDTVYSEPVVIRTTLQAVACRIYAPFQVTICNIYFPPGDRVDQTDLEDLLTQLPRPLIFLGDFNALSTLWNSNTTNTKGRIIENILDRHDLIPLNNDSPTHLCTRTGTLSNIDVTTCSPDILTRLKWRVKTDPLNSDHFPIYIQIDGPPEPFQIPVRFNTKKANWTKYTQFIIDNLAFFEINTIEDFNHLVISAAESSIPKTKTVQKHIPVPWWNNRCKEAVKKKI